MKSNSKLLYRTDGKERQFYFTSNILKSYLFTCNILKSYLCCWHFIVKSYTAKLTFWVLFLLKINETFLLPLLMQYNLIVGCRCKTKMLTNLEKKSNRSFCANFPSAIKKYSSTLEKKICLRFYSFERTSSFYKAYPWITWELSFEW
jgi:hypothetical protein